MTRFRDFKYAETMFDLLARQFELAKVDEAKDGVLVQVVDPAEVPEWKSRPKRGLIAVIAAFAGLVAGGLFVSTRRSYRRNNNSETMQKLALLLGRRPFGKQ